MHEKNFTMQTEEADEAVSCSETFIPEKMTFAKNSTFVPSTADQTVDPLEFCSTTIKIEDINLEDEIEKVEATSEDEDSSSASEEKLSDVSINQLAIPLFTEIPEENPNESVKNWLKQITEAQTGFQKKNFAALGLQTVGNAPSRMVKYEDLPYMGEITLNNSKPRRGRKPKKADICHLIYKNYGTIFPGTPNAKNYLNAGLKKEVTKSGQKASKSNDNIQNKIISSLLEKRLTQDSPGTEIAKSSQPIVGEPLNLCVRDHNPLKIRFLKNKKDNTYTSEIKSEPQSDEDVEPRESTLNTPPPSVESRVPLATPDSVSTSSTEPNTPENTATAAPGSFAYWPNSGEYQKYQGVFLHPLALQQQLMVYQRLAANNQNFVLPSHSPRPPPVIESPTPDERCPESQRKASHKKSHEPGSGNQKEKMKRNISHSQASTSGTTEKNPAKRKRSAIFIPPIPAENSTNPATEVSICKFKFTGGAKPSLQEKKMLSVDSGGNFRYYSGTGDKSMRGYEFFPREQLQQQVTNAQGSSTGAFLQASGEKIYAVPPAEFTANSGSDFLLNHNVTRAACPSTSPQQDPSNTKKDKKRKSRKSLQREKLEKTFKEKGFLIQTQQLESSEGATYCKFRQLKKFTRYLFRSWKDYLPGEFQGQPGQGSNGETSSTITNGEFSIDSTVDSGNSGAVEMPSSSTSGLPL